MYRYITILIAFFFAAAVHAQKPANDPAYRDLGVGMVDDYQRISDTYGNFTGTLSDNDYFGSEVEAIGDLNGDGIIDLAVGAPKDDDGGTDEGAVWILFMDTGRLVKAHYKISDTLETANDTLNAGDSFGESIAAIGDLNGDGIPDIAVGAIYDDETATNAGAIYILFLDTNGHVKSSQKITEGVGGFNGDLDADDRFAYGMDGLGDFDGDGIQDLLVGSYLDDDGGTNRGAIYLLFLDTDGTVKSHKKVSEVPGVYIIGLSDHDYLGTDVVAIGDLNGDGITDIAAGAQGDDDGNSAAGAVWIFLMNSDGTVLSEQKIATKDGPHPGQAISTNDNFGCSLAAMGDMNKDGIPDLAVGARQDDDGNWSNSGALWFLYLSEEGKAKEVSKISKSMSNFKAWQSWINQSDYFAQSLTCIGDYDNNGAADIAVGAVYDDDGGPNRGAIYIIELDSLIEPSLFDGHVRMDYNSDKLRLLLANHDRFGSSIAAFDSLNNDSNSDLVVGAFGDDDGGTNRGALYVLFLDNDADIDSVQKISDTEGGFTGVLDDSDYFGFACANIGDLNGDTVQDLVVGSHGDDDGGTDRGAIWILFMNNDGTVKSHQKISDSLGNFTDSLDDGIKFGWSVASIGDVNQDSINDIAVGAPLADDGGTDEGAIWVLMMDTNGTVKSHQRISDTTGNFLATLNDGDYFGYSIAGVGDFNEDSIPDIAVGAPYSDITGTDRGMVWVLYLDTNGTVKYDRELVNSSGGYFSAGSYLGRSLANIGDYDYDGINDLAVGRRNTELNHDEGGFLILLLDTNAIVLASQLVSSAEGGLAMYLVTNDKFAEGALTFIPNINGAPAIGVGANQANLIGTGGSGNYGAAYILKGKKKIKKGPPFTPIFDSYGYAQLTKKLDGNYYHTQGSDLRVQYSEDYYVSDTKNLTYTIYDEQWNTVTNTPAAPIDFGDNRLLLNLGNTGSYPGNFFILEVENDKNEKEYLRFKYK